MCLYITEITADVYLCLYILKRINKKQDQWLLFKFLLESGLFSMQYWHHNHT